jgi:RNA 2',3'-cyclic 3'-phosphodiesterase
VTSNSAATKTARLFFALWPESEIQALIARHAERLHQQVGGKITRTESIHLTLVFLGQVSLETVPQLGSLARAAPSEPFVLKLDKLGCWPKNNIGWIGPQRTPTALATLVQALQQGSEALGISIDQRPYAPHITLVRKAACKRVEPQEEPVQWRVRDFALVHSNTDSGGSRYSVIGRWPSNEPDAA